MIFTIVNVMSLVFRIEKSIMYDCSVLSKLLEPRLIFVFGEFLSEPSKSFRITS